MLLSPVEINHLGYARSHVRCAVWDAIMTMGCLVVDTCMLHMTTEVRDAVTVSWYGSVY
jgi:hypothetical protein